MQKARVVSGMLVVLVAAQIGCGMAEGGAARPPARTGAIQTHNDRITVASEGREQSDNDSDGIPDKKDALPEEARAEQAPSLVGTPGVPPPPPPKPGNVQQTQQDDARDGAFLIYTAQLTMAVYQVEAALGLVEQIARDAGGYLATRADRAITIRVPRARFEEALKKIEATGDVIHRDIQAQDVTEDFRDTEVRLKNARAMRDRLEQLLQKAPVKEALEIEKELGRVTEEIERMEGHLKLLKDKIAFSTITVSFDARAASLRTMPIRLPFPWLGDLGLPTLLRLNETK